MTAIDLPSRPIIQWRRAQGKLIGYNGIMWQVGTLLPSSAARNDRAETSSQVTMEKFGCLHKRHDRIQTRIR